jgi:hypothetical protein
MDKKQLFNIWASSEGDVWTRFAKPALFANITTVALNRFNPASVPSNLWQFFNSKTAFIIDLPGAGAIEAGIGLAKTGFRPVPLYNAICVHDNGGLRAVIDNTPIINALIDAAGVLKTLEFQAKATPAFLLDSNRSMECFDVHNMYDNRWNVDTDDMPNADYMKENGISRLVVWTDKALQDDLKEIISGYSNAGIEIVTYINGQIKFETAGTINPLPVTPVVAPEIKEAVRMFENARFGLLIVSIIAGVNLLGMFVVFEEPFLWTAPTIMWLTYLWVSEITGDVIALAMTAAYFALYVLSNRNRGLIIPALLLFGIDVVVLFIYALQYGLIDYIGESFLYGGIVFATPVILLSLIFKGAKAYITVRNINDYEYSQALDAIDCIRNDTNNGNFPPSSPASPMSRRRGIFRPYRGANYRGFGGYGGTGRGGYGGTGSRGGFGG